jgi:hypothetical protein
LSAKVECFVFVFCYLTLNYFIDPAHSPSLNPTKTSEPNLCISWNYVFFFLFSCCLIFECHCLCQIFRYISFNLRNHPYLVPLIRFTPFQVISDRFRLYIEDMFKYFTQPLSKWQLLLQDPQIPPMQRKTPKLTYICRFVLEINCLKG